MGHQCFLINHTRKQIRPTDSDICSHISASLANAITRYEWHLTDQIALVVGGVIDGDNEVDKLLLNPTHPYDLADDYLGYFLESDEIDRYHRQKDAFLAVESDEIDRYHRQKDAFLATRKAHLSALLNAFIRTLSGSLVTFDYTSREILFQLTTLSGLSAELHENNLEGENDERRENMVVSAWIDEIIQSNGTKSWFDAKVPECGSGDVITKLRIKNVSGFNDDPRSHRGDCLPDKSKIYGKRIKVTPQPAFHDRVPEYEDEEDIFNVDYACHFPEWEKVTPSGVTLGDIMEGIMMVKGSKSDWWYELMGSPEVEITGNTLNIVLDFDHGS